ncbi:hypothetical protein BpHYR1_026768 [Brachionus plicatilis]|uniref:Uncharacterized protein n=1 Tax=Brachionus plicatilis TaxID=10195 RepID=A0A3M7PXM4_BRAPC|nr:hypothetical protein BpHYR1_026768 [Brachionus plicatilis]
MIRHVEFTLAKNGRIYFLLPFLTKRKFTKIYVKSPMKKSQNLLKIYQNLHKFGHFLAKFNYNIGKIQLRNNLTLEAPKRSFLMPYKISMLFLFYAEKKNYAQKIKIYLDFSGQKSKKSHFDSLVFLVGYLYRFYVLYYKALVRYRQTNK